MHTSLRQRGDYNMLVTDQGGIPLNCQVTDTFLIPHTTEVSRWVKTSKSEWLGASISPFHMHLLRCVRVVFCVFDALCAHPLDMDNL